MKKLTIWPFVVSVFIGIPMRGEIWFWISDISSPVHLLLLIVFLGLCLLLGIALGAIVGGLLPSKYVDRPWFLLVGFQPI